MHWIVLVGAFFLFWFLSLQIVLPIGNRTADEAGETLAAGTDPSAPANPRLGLKLAAATIAAILMWSVLYGLVLAKVLDL
jgi:predicted secreted protein